jgi:hypothetical protein
MPIFKKGNTRKARALKAQHGARLNQESVKANGQPATEEQLRWMQLQQDRRGVWSGHGHGEYPTYKEED